MGAAVWLEGCRIKLSFLLQWETVLSARCVCPSMLALPRQPSAWQTVSRGHGSSSSRHGMVLGCSHSQRVLFPLAGVERSCIYLLPPLLAWGKTTVGSPFLPLPRAWRCCPGGSGAGG